MTQKCNKNVMLAVTDAGAPSPTRHGNSNPRPGDFGWCHCGMSTGELRSGIVPLCCGSLLLQGVGTKHVNHVIPASSLAHRKSCRCKSISRGRLKSHLHSRACTCLHVSVRKMPLLWCSVPTKGRPRSVDDHIGDDDDELVCCCVKTCTIYCRSLKTSVKIGLRPHSQVYLTHWTAAP